MDELDLKGIIGDLNKTKIDGSVIGLFKEVKEVFHAAKGAAEEFKAIVDLAEKIGIKPLLVRAAAKKLDVDAETPLKSENTIIPQSENHKLLFNQLNRLNQDQLSEFVAKNLQLAQQQQQKEEKVKK